MAKPKIKHTITKKEWDKKHKDFKLMGKDGIPYIMTYDSKIGTHLVPVKIVKEEMDESVGAELDLIKQSSKDVKDFLKNVFKDSDFRAMKNDKDFVKYLKSMYEGIESVNEVSVGVNVHYFYKKANKNKNNFFKMLSDFRKKHSDIKWIKMLNYAIEDFNENPAKYKTIDDKQNILFKKLQNESVVNEAKEPEVITQLRKIVKDKQNSLVVDTKSKRKVRVDMNSANLMVQVYDALKKQSNKDKFVKSGIVAMGHMAYKLMRNESVNEGKFDGIGDLVKSLHFEINPKTAEEKKIELGKRQGEVSKRKQIESGEYSLRLFRKKIKYGNGKDVGVFLPGSYDASVSTLGDGPHKKAVKKVRWTQKKYDQWLEDMASNGGARNAFDMAQNAKNEPGLIDWVKKNFRGDKPLQRIQWDIEGFNESVNEAYVVLHSPKKGVKPVATAAYTDKKDAEKWAKDLGGITMIVKKKMKGIDEAKGDLQIYHKSYTLAIEEAKRYAYLKGYTIADDELFTKVGLNSKRPSVGKTTRVSLELLKKDKPQRKMLHIQVYGMKNMYELNAYIN